jgi:transcriptional regulator
MRPNPQFALHDTDEIRRLILENPWATLVTHTTGGLVASHYPVLVDESRDEFSIVTHLAREMRLVHHAPD